MTQSCVACDGPVSSDAAFCMSCGAPTQHATAEQHRSYWTTRSVTARLGVDGLMAAIAVIVGGVAVAVGALLPWMTISAPLIGTTSRSGVQLEGAWVLIVLGSAATAAAVGALVGTRVLPSRWSIAAVGVVSGIFLVAASRDISSRLAKLSDMTNVATGTYGSGLWVAVTGAILLTAGATRLPAGKGISRRVLTAGVLASVTLAVGVAGRQALARQAANKLDQVSAELASTTTTSLYYNPNIVQDYGTNSSYSSPTTSYQPTTTTTITCPAKSVAKLSFSAAPDTLLGAGNWNVSVSGSVTSNGSDLDLRGVTVHYRTTSKDIDGTIKNSDETSVASVYGTVHQGRSAPVSSTDYATSIARPVMTSVEIQGSWADSTLYRCPVS